MYFYKKEISAEPTELEILRELEVIVEQALPLEKLKKTYKDLNNAKNFILNRVTFCQTRVGVSLSNLCLILMKSH